MKELSVFEIETSKTLYYIAAMTEEQTQKFIDESKSIKRNDVYDVRLLSEQEMGLRRKDYTTRRAVSVNEVIRSGQFPQPPCILFQTKIGKR